MATDGGFKNSTLGIIVIGVVTSLIASWIWAKYDPSTAASAPQSAASSAPTSSTTQPSSQASPSANTRTACVFDPVSNVRAFPTSSSAIVCSIDSVRDIQVGLNATNTGKAIWWTTNACGSPGYIADNQVHVDMSCSR